MVAETSFLNSLFFTWKPIFFIENKYFQLLTLKWQAHLICLEKKNLQNIQV